MPINLLKTDPAIAMPSAEIAMPSAKFDVLVADWCRLEAHAIFGRCQASEPGIRLSRFWSPTTNAAHAGEARRKVVESELLSHGNTISGEMPGIWCNIWCKGIKSQGRCMLSEVTGSTDAEIKERAEALATCRAILAAIQAKHKQAEAGGDDD